MFRNLALFSCAAVCCAAALLFGGGTAAGEEPLRLRVLTYNIHHGRGMDEQIDLPRIAAVIRRAEPDLAALQEVDRRTRRSAGVDQAAELARLTQMHGAFGKAMDFAGGEYGVALLARWPLENVQTHPLPAVEPGHEPRAALAAEVRAGERGPRVRFVSTHLDHVRGAVRLAQAQRLAAALDAESPPPTILAGDLNDGPQSELLKWFRTTWADATGEDPRPTWPSDRPREKLDYVLFRPPDGWRVVAAEVIDEPAASDHLPLLVVLERAAAP